jgi:hypothetical protein
VRLAQGAMDQVFVERHGRKLRDAPRSAA